MRLWTASTFDEIESYPPTRESMFRLGQLRNREDRFEEAEAILRVLLALQKKHAADHADIERTKTEITKSLASRDLMPVITRQPESADAVLGDGITMSVQLGEGGPWELQWFRNGQPIDGAVQAELSLKLEGEEDFGAYHLEASPAGRDDVFPIRSDFAYLTEKGTVHNQGLRWEVYKDIPGKLVSDLVGSGKFPNDPDETQFIENFEIPSDDDDDYGGRVRGLLTPPVTGEYVFYLCSDNASELYLSDTETPNDEKLVASQSHGPPRHWRSAGKDGTSKPIHLERGKRYSVRALFKERGGQDYLAVAWQMPGQRPPRNGDPPIPGLFLRHRPE